MLDLETLDTKASAAILSIGVVFFDPDNPGVLGTKLHEFVSIDSNLSAGRTVSGSTLLWWMDQDVLARKRMLEGQQAAVPLPVALAKATALLDHNTYVWGNGAAFDNAILANAYESCDMQVPWHFRNDRCFRTIKQLNLDVRAPSYDGVEHDALDDAIRQALHLQMIFQKLKNK